MPLGPTGHSQYPLKGIEFLNNKTAGLVLEPNEGLINARTKMSVVPTFRVLTLTIFDFQAFGRLLLAGQCSLLAFEHNT